MDICLIKGGLMGLIFQIDQQICSYCNTPDKRQYKMISIFHPRIGVILLGSSEKMTERLLEI